MIFVIFSLMFLDDEESVVFLKKCRENLREGGTVIMWDNFTFEDEGDYVVF